MWPGPHAPLARLRIRSALGAGLLEFSGVPLAQRGPDCPAAQKVDPKVVLCFGWKLA